MLPWQPQTCVAVAYKNRKVDTVMQVWELRLQSGSLVGKHGKPRALHLQDYCVGTPSAKAWSGTPPPEAYLRLGAGKAPCVLEILP
jgi:hypothetical protein